MAERHSVLYDVERWRRYRTFLLLPATAFLMTAVLISVLRPQAGGGVGYAVAGVVLLAIAASLWTRTRFTYLTRQDDAVVVRSMATRHRLVAADIDRARVIRLSAVMARADRRHLVPRPAEWWMSTEALSLSLHPGVDTRALQRILGARCLLDGALVVPVAHPQALLAEVLEHVCPPPREVSAGRGPRRRGRRR